MGLDDAVVSIHALAKSATKRATQMTNDNKVSIHALAKSATFMRWGCITLVKCFNPRAREERDHRH